MQQRKKRTEEEQKSATLKRKRKRMVRHTPEGYQFTSTEYTLNALGNFLTLLAAGRIELSLSDEVQLKRLTRFLIRMFFRGPWRSARKSMARKQEKALRK